MKLLKLPGYLLFGIFLLFFTFCHRVEKDISRDQIIQNLCAFSKLYGYVRFFHPSDQAALIDWDLFAIYGAEKVRNASNQKELMNILEELFLPIAPTVQIYPEGGKPAPFRFPENYDTLKVVAWQHLGVGLGSSSGVYRSNRISRERISNNPEEDLGIVSQGIDASPYRGKEIRLTASVCIKTRDQNKGGHLWVRVVKENNQMGFVDEMEDRPILSINWNEYEIKGHVAENAAFIYFGFGLNGNGEAWVDDFKLFYRNNDGNWEPIPINNPGFENGKNGKPAHWRTGSYYNFLLVSDKHKEGNHSLLIENSNTVFEGMLFNEYPKVGEVINKKLCGNLYCMVPLALFNEDGRNLSRKKTSTLDRLLSDLKKVGSDELTANNESVRIADIVIAWNVFQHFYPYFDVVDIDWNTQLTHFLEEALSNQNEKDFYNTLRELVASIRDGHGHVYHKISEKQAGFNFQVDWIEDQVVITYSKDSLNFIRGDIIVSIDGIPAREILKEEEIYLSGSDQWKRYKALNRFSFGDKGTVASLNILRNGKIIQVDAKRNKNQPVAEPKKSIYKIRDDIYYVNLDITPMAEINNIMEDLAKARGVIFDLRGYPKGNHEVINHLLVEADTSGSWMQVPEYIYPDQENIVGYQYHGWFIPPKKPHISGKVIFITDGRAISYAESFLSFIEHYRLAEIVGQPTAGTNGNVNFFNLPGKFRVTWTGMKVVKHDGSQHHLIGIQPTVPVSRSIRGVREGRDEFLEKAIEIIQ